MTKMFNFSRLLCAALLLFTFTACQKDDFLNFPLPGPDTKPSDLEITFYALADGHSLDKFSTSNPKKLLTTAMISGLQSGEKILAIDFRPATGQLYGLGSTSRLYVINPETGAARAIDSGAFSPAVVRRYCRV